MDSKNHLNLHFEIDTRQRLAASLCHGMYVIPHGANNTCDVRRVPLKIHQEGDPDRDQVGDNRWK